MASTRSLQPLVATARRAPRPVARLAAKHVIRKQLLNTDTAPILYSAHAKAKGARTGRIEGDDLKVDLVMAKALEGAGDRGKTNPEELFVAGYGACFQSAMNASAAALGTKMPTDSEDSVVSTTVHLVGDMEKLDMGIRVDMKVSIRGLERDRIEKIVEKAKEVCPYIRATRGNTTTNVEAVQL
ncbi:hypothetical protein NUW58_g3874 [Xylaria curta]|uniref:Uncharacterized protein n=1 Tax=Xylaria curta TaxID=42375 RepID=A0ACC1PAK5_9PEZI|nr:hypothetical protein NUW58_g3874 [Xylaria curta]